MSLFLIPEGTAPLPRALSTGFECILPASNYIEGGQVETAAVVNSTTAGRAPHARAPPTDVASTRGRLADFLRAEAGAATAWETAVRAWRDWLVVANFPSFHSACAPNGARLFVCSSASQLALLRL